MKAFKVYYGTLGKTTEAIVLAKNESKLAEALEKKDRDFSLTDDLSVIVYAHEVPMSNVMLSDLTIDEFKMIFSK